MVASDPDLPQLPPEATHQDLVCTLNKLTTKFLDKCLADHLDTALCLESDDWSANYYTQRKVSLFLTTFISHACLSSLIIQCLAMHVSILVCNRFIRWLN
jgi:hypothetical protein